MNSLIQELQCNDARGATPHRPGADGLVLATTPIKGRTALADQHLSLVFDPGTDMVCAASVDETVTARILGRTISYALRDLHVPKGATVEVITTGTRDARALPEAVRRASGRTIHVRQIGWDRMGRYERSAFDIARSLSVACAYEAAMGWADLSTAEHRRMFVEATLEQVLYWHHRKSPAVPGAKSPIERLAARQFIIGGEA